MTIPFLDALLPSTAPKPATNHGGQGASDAFEALLAGLNASVATLPGEAPVAAPGTALPPTGKTLPVAGRPVATGEVTDGQVADDHFAVMELSRTLDEPSEAPVYPAQESVPVPALPAAPELIAQATAAPLALPIAASPRLVPTSPTPATGAVAPALTPRMAAEPAPTTQPTPATPRKTTSGGTVLASQNGLATPVALLAPEPRASTAQAVQPAADAPKPAQSFAPSLAIVATGAQPSVPGAASPTLRRGPESKPATISLTAALSVAPEAAAAAIFAAPAAVLAAPVAVAPGTSVPEVATSPAQPAASPNALPDHRALVEALMRARTERDPGLSVALDTREFGAVALRFETLQSATGERSLQVAFSSGDPGFERAVASAAAAQSALADQSGRNPANRADPAPMRSGEYLGDGPGARSSSSDPHAQQRSAPDGSMRDDTRSRQSADPRVRGEDYPAPAPRADRRRGSIFA